MAVQYHEIQELLRSRADLYARLNLMPYDGTPEIKERGDGKYLYVRKRVADKQTSTYTVASISTLSPSMISFTPISFLLLKLKLSIYPFFR